MSARKRQSRGAAKSRRARKRKVSGRPAESKSEYNPRGLLVVDIFRKIHDAFEYDTTIPVDLSGGLEFYLHRSQLATWTVERTENDGWALIEPPGALTVRFRNLLDADQEVIKPDDQKLVEEIREHPMRLLYSPRHADAIARWTYGQSYGVSPETRKQAAALVRAVKPPKPSGGAPPRFRGNLGLLREAHEELVVYGDGLRSCIRDTKLPEVVTTHFPDCRELTKAGCADPATLVDKPAKEIPTGKQLATKVFESLVGWGLTQIKKKLYPKTR